MDCPACGRSLTAMPVNGVIVDACAGGCGGAWFDKHEIEAFDEPGEFADPLLTIVRDEAVVTDGAPRRACPRCRDIIMQRHFFSHRFEVEVDECAGCGGLWLDHGELQGIRAQFRSQQEREADRDEFLARGMAPHLAGLTSPTPTGTDRADRLSRLFHWLCPSHWIPGRAGPDGR